MTGKGLYGVEALSCAIAPKIGQDSARPEGCDAVGIARAPGKVTSAGSLSADLPTCLFLLFNLLTSQEMCIYKKEERNVEMWKLGFLRDG
ncbi:MAG: hypothetical protein NZ742_06895, partial [Acidobacteria bacterium]|nr:hypothetical protein [Acidobacteriota bacterium]